MVIGHMPEMLRDGEKSCDHSRDPLIIVGCPGLVDHLGTERDKGGATGLCDDYKPMCCQ